MISPPDALTYWRRQRATVALVVVVVTTGSYLTFLGWHELQDYERLPIACLALFLVVLAGWAGWRGPFVIGSLVLTATLVTLWSIDAATGGSDGADLWPVGAFMLAFPTAAGAFLVSWLVGTARRVNHRSRS